MSAEATNLIIPERLAAFTALHNGAHAPNDDGEMCALEATAWIAAGAAIAPTKEALIESARALVIRMIEAEA